MSLMMSSSWVSSLNVENTFSWPCAPGMRTANTLDFGCGSDDPRCKYLNLKILPWLDPRDSPQPTRQTGEMRSRSNRKRGHSEDIITTEPEQAHVVASQTEDMSASSDVMQASPPTELTRTKTREEITQTDDEDIGELSTKRPWIQYRRLIFVLGCLMGIVLAWAFRSPDLQFEGLLDSVDMTDFFDDLKAALPSAL